MSKISKIPHFKNDAEAADFFDSHDSTTYLAQTKTANLSFPKPAHKIVIELGEKQFQRLRALASGRKISYTRLLQRIIARQLAS